jgi:putative addiction module component (TIGR02574 family)
MTKAEELISMVESLPIDIKTQLIEKLLNSLHPSQKEIDEFWAKEAEKRNNEIKTGKVKTVTGKKIIEKFGDDCRNEIFFSPFCNN